MTIKAAFKSGLDLHFFANATFEHSNSASSEQSSLVARNALRLLTMGWPAESWKQLFSWPVFKAVFLQRDPKLLKEFRFAFQDGFKTLFHQLHGKELTPEQREQIQLYISNCLSLLPYSDLTPYESVKVPQNIDNEWVLVDYFVKPIELAKTSHNKSIDHDRVFAYGLEPITNEKATPHLIFMGTTYPAGQGFIPQIDTDFEAFNTVGTSLYRAGRAKIQDWLVKQKNKANVCGVSLGGALSLLLAIDMGEYLSRVDALNPPGLYEKRKKSIYDRWDELVSKPQVVVQQQADDPVSCLGVWKADWEIIQVIPPANRKGPNAFLDHFLNYAGFADTQFIYTSAAEQNLKRQARNFWIYTLGRSMVYYLAIAPFSRIIRPSIYFLLNNKTPIMWGLFIAAVLASLIALTVTGTLPVLAFVGVLAITVVTSALYYLPKLIQYFAREQDGSEHHATTDEVNNFAKMHDPSLPRNEAMDIYNEKNVINVGFTQKELSTYYRAVRCLLKEKEFIPAYERHDKAYNGLSKKELMLQLHDPKQNDAVLMLKRTKAKTMHIKHSLTLIGQLGVENEQALKDALDKEHRQYCLGKV